jgi:hypothetical protein
MGWFVMVVTSFSPFLFLFLVQSVSKWDG